MLWIFHRAGEIVDQDRRRRRGDDDIGPDAFASRRQHLALELDHFRHAFEHEACAGQCGSHVVHRRHGDPREDGIGVGLGQQSEPRKARQRFTDLAERLGFEFRKLFGRPRLDVDHDDGVAGIGERHRDAAAHAAGAETGDDGADSRHCSKSLAQQRLQLVTIEMAQPQGSQRAAAFQKILTADRATDGKEGPCQRRRHSGRSGDGDEK